MAPLTQSYYSFADGAAAFEQELAAAFVSGSSMIFAVQINGHCSELDDFIEELNTAASAANTEYGSDGYVITATGSLVAQRVLF